MNVGLCAARVYMAGSSGAVLFCLHGCGYTGLTWACVAAAVKDRCVTTHTHTLIHPYPNAWRLVYPAHAV